MIQIPDLYLPIAMTPLPTSGRIPMEIALLAEHATRSAPGTRYFTGRPCGKGHLSDRYGSTANCVECQLAASSASRTPRVYGPPVVLPPCISERGRPTFKYCIDCERRVHCAGVYSTMMIRRAQRAFPDFSPYTRADARRQGLRFYKPSEPCHLCGIAAWRDTQTTLQCAGCLINRK